jgi:hypothetical protein
MQGQGATPDAQKPEYKEKKPGGYRYEFNNMDMDADRYISREEAKVNRHLFEQFEQLDKDNDNRLDKTELSAFQTGPRASAAGSVGATVDEIVKNREAYLGQRVTVRGKVDKIHGPRALVIRGDDRLFNWLVAEELPILSAAPFPYTNVLDRDLLQDATVHVTGTVRKFSTVEIERELGWDLHPELQMEFEGKGTVLIVEAITLAPPN